MPTYIQHGEGWERDDTGQLGYRYYWALTKRKVDAAVAKIEKEKANLQQKRRNVAHQWLLVLSLGTMVTG